MKLLMTSLLLFFALMTFAQSDQEISEAYKNVVIKSNSLLKKGKIADLNYSEVEKLATNLDQQYPSEYLKSAYEYSKKGKYNESAFLYFLSEMRIVDFNKNGQSEHWDNSEKGMILNEILFIYLATDADNFRKIIELVTNYYDKNDYTFIQKNKNYQKVKHPKNYQNLIKEFKENPKVVQENLKKDRDDMIKKINYYF